MKTTMKNSKKKVNLKKNNSNNSYNCTEGTKKVPSCVLRKCCACGKIIDRTNLIKILKDHKTGDIIINPNSKTFGRSIYLCKTEECLKLAIKKKRLKHLPENIIDNLKKF